MKIGITERGDAALSIPVWESALITKKVDGAILITKSLTANFVKAVIDTYFNITKHIVVHCTCTGMGGTIFEPNVPAYQTQLNQLRVLIDSGFPIEQCVLRIDPIIPNEEGLENVSRVLNYAYEQGLLPKIRVRISVYDEYKHVKERLVNAGLEPIYPNGNFSASQKQFDYVAEKLSRWGIPFHTCAEPKLRNPLGKELFIHPGCISNIDLKAMGLPEINAGINPQNRYGCQCLACKTELLSNRHPCAHNCIYCYWRD